MVKALAALLFVTTLIAFCADRPQGEPEKSWIRTADQTFDPRKMPPSAVQRRSMEAAYRANPITGASGSQLMSVFTNIGQTNDADALSTLDSLFQTVTNDAPALVWVQQGYSVLGQPAKAQSVVFRLVPLVEKVLADPQSTSVQLQAALQTFQLAGNVPRMEQCLNRLLKLASANPELWYDFAAILSFQTKTNTAITAVSNALHHSDIRLRQNPHAQNLRSMARTDPRFNSIRSDPTFKNIVTAQP